VFSQFLQVDINLVYYWMTVVLCSALFRRDGKELPYTQVSSNIAFDIRLYGTRYFSFIAQMTGTRNPTNRDWEAKVEGGAITG